MLLGEPPRTPWDLNFWLFGFPVRVHPLFWLVAIFLGASGDVRGLLTWVVVLFVSILLHELGHATAMRAYGLQPSILLYGLGGLAIYNQLGASRSGAPQPRSQILISLAGPGAGFLLAAVLIAAIKLSGHHVEFFPLGVDGPWIVTDPIGSPLFGRFLRQLLFFNIIWGLVNLLPVYPLDGGQIAREILVNLNPRDGIRQSLMLSVFAAAGVAVFAVSIDEWFVVILFGYLAYSSYTTLQSYRGRGRWQ